MGDSMVNQNPSAVFTGDDTLVYADFQFDLRWYPIEAASA
jgi:hypothetical protein